MGKPKITIHDSLFMAHQKSASVGGDNIHLRPTHFEWQWIDDPKTARFVTDSEIKYAAGPGQIAWLLEPRELHPENYEFVEARAHEFDAVLSHDLDLIHRLPNGCYCPLGGSWIGLDDWGMKEKTNNVSMIMSDKKSMPGHRLRHIVRDGYGYLIEDIFGHGINPIEGKYDALAPYRFSVVIESEKSAGYFTEKLIDCLSVGTIPIYWGGVPPFDLDGLILVRGIKDIVVALEEIFESGEHIYEQRKKHVDRNIDLARQYVICEDNINEYHPWMLE